MFTQEQTDAITKIVTTAVTAALPAAQPATVTPENVQTLDKDPAMEHADEAEGKLLKQLTNPQFMMVRGRRGCRLVNVTKDSLDAIRNWKQERNQFGNSVNVR